MIAPRHLLFGLAALGLLMGSIDSTIVAVAVPALGSALRASLTSVGWTLTAYLVVQIMMLPVAGKLSDSFGRKRVFLFCLSTFTLGSLLCGIAPSIGWLIAFRGVQALGGGGLVPGAIGIVADLYPKNRAQAVGLFTSIGPIGAILGPNLGGYVLEHLTWRELFFINVPVGLCVLAGVTLLLTDKQQAKRQLFTLDIVGLGLYASAILLLMGGMSLAGADPSVWRNPGLWGMLGMSLLLGLLFAHHIRSADNPVVDPAILLRRPFVAANLYSFAFGAATFGFFSFLPLYGSVASG